MRALTAPQWSIPVVLGVTMLVTGCGNKDAAQAANATPAREIQLAPAAPVTPQLNDVPEKAAPTPAPRSRKAAPPPRRIVEAPPPPTPTPAPAPQAPEPAVVVRPLAPPAPSMGTIATGTSFSVTPSVRVCTNTHKVGDRFTATLANSVQGSDGATIPAGSAVVLRVTESSRSENSKDNIKLGFDVISVKVGNDTYDVDGRVSQVAVEKVRAQSTTDQAKKVGAGAAIGAIAGQLFGHNTKSTVIGAVVGGAAGTAVAAGTADYDGCVPANGVVNITLMGPLRIRTGA